MPLINNDTWGRRIVRVGAVAAARGKWLALTAAILLVLTLAVIVLR
ncbi:hypothetical protein [Actinoplanes sp. NPDC049316]